MSALANVRDRSTEMVIKATGNSWVEIEDINGNTLMTRLMRSGETYVVPNKSGLTFNTGNAGALSLSHGNILIPALGEVGEIINARPLKVEAFQNKQIIN
jgi:cytoskeleton protein RodZ